VTVSDDFQCDYLLVDPGTYGVLPTGYGNVSTLSMAKALSLHFRVKVIGFGARTQRFFRDDVEVIILRNPLRVPINRGLFGYTLNAMTSEARLVLALIRGKVPRN
jgi:hypothetical protein